MSKITIDTYLNGALAKRIVQEYEYDTSGIKVRQTETVDEDGNGTVDTRKVTEYLNDAMNHTGYTQVLEERTTENGGPVKVTTYTIGHDVLAQFNAAAGFLALLADGHGSTRAVADNNGTIVQQYNYDAYGNALGFDAGEALTNLLYSGEQFNPVSGLQYLRARWYNPQSGTFNRLDPFSGNRQAPLSFHKYAYAANNPMRYSDPSGQSWLVYAIIGSLLVGAYSHFVAENPVSITVGLMALPFVAGLLSGLITTWAAGATISLGGAGIAAGTSIVISAGIPILVNFGFNVLSEYLSGSFSNEPLSDVMNRVGVSTALDMSNIAGLYGVYDYVKQKHGKQFYSGLAKETEAGIKALRTGGVPTLSLKYTPNRSEIDRMAESLYRNKSLRDRTSRNLSDSDRMIQGGMSDSDWRAYSQIMAWQWCYEKAMAQLISDGK